MKKKMIKKMQVTLNIKKIIQSTGPPCHCQENIDDFKDGLIITTVTTTTIVIVYALRAVDVGQLKALLISTMVT